MKNTIVKGVLYIVLIAALGCGLWFVLAFIQNPTEPEEVKVYRYQDENGVWSFSSEKPTTAHEEYTVPEPATVSLETPLLPKIPDLNTSKPKGPKVVIIGNSSNKEEDGQSSSGIARDDPRAELQDTRNDFMRQLNSDLENYNKKE